VHTKFPYFLLIVHTNFPYYLSKKNLTDLTNLNELKIKCVQIS